MRDARYEIRDTRHETRGARCETRDARCEVRDARCEVRDARCEMRDTRCETRNASLQQRFYIAFLSNLAPSTSNISSHNSHPSPMSRHKAAATQALCLHGARNKFHAYVEQSYICVVFESSWLKLFLRTHQIYIAFTLVSRISHHASRTSHLEPSSQFLVPST